MQPRTQVLVAAIASLLSAPLAYAVPPAIAAAAATSAGASPEVAAMNVTTIPALGLSYKGQYLAWITVRGGKTKLMLASSAGKHVHVVPIPGVCAETGLRWARKWNTLALLTRCPADTSGSRAVHAALWVVDVGVGVKPAIPRKVADIPGTASDLQWRTDDKVIAFLYRPDAATHWADTQSSLAVAPSPVQSIAAVPATGGIPQLTTPADWNVHEYRLLPQNGGVLYTASMGADAENEAPSLYLQTGHIPEVLFDPATAKGALHGLQVSLPSVTAWLPAMVSFLGRQPGATDGRLYTLWPGHDPHPESFGSGRVAWYASQGIGTLAVYTIRVGDGVRVSYGSYPFTTAGPISYGRYAFTIPGTISAGTKPFSVAMPYPNFFPNAAWGAHATNDGYGGGGASVAFVQTLPGQPPVIRAGHFSPKPPPIVWSAGPAQVAMASH